jgi:hypothetical protein
MVNPFTSGPIALYRNPPIQPQYYAPSQFIIDDIVLGTSTVISTTFPTNYVIGQLVRLHIPFGNGCQQLNGAVGYLTGYSVSTPDDIIEENIKVQENPINPTYSNFNVLTVTQKNFPTETVRVVPNTYNMIIGSTYYKDDGVGNVIYISGVYTISSATIDYSTGQVVMNFIVTPSRRTLSYNFTANLIYIIPGTVEGIILNIDSSQNVNAFVESNISDPPTIAAIGDVNSGYINANGNMNVGTSIPGTFTNISPY